MIRNTNFIVTSIMLVIIIILIVLSKKYTIGTKEICTIVVPLRVSTIFL